MRKRWIIGNWKMNTNIKEAQKLMVEMRAEEFNDNVNLAICPPFTHIFPLSQAILASGDSRFMIGAQDCSANSKGAFTGECSAEMSGSAGARIVIVGHSERRALHGEGGEMMFEKIQQVLAHGQTVIYCIGETLAQRENGHLKEVLLEQLDEGVFKLEERSWDSVIVAYEPVWAIGTGVTASPEQAQEVHQFIRSELSKRLNAEIASKTSILYGGSCKPSNAKEIFAKKDIDGGLIGGASLKAKDFAALSHCFA